MMYSDMPLFLVSEDGKIITPLKEIQTVVPVEMQDKIKPPDETYADLFKPIEFTATLGWIRREAVNMLCGWPKRNSRHPRKRLLYRLLRGQK